MSKQSGAGVIARWLVLPAVLAMVIPTAGVFAQDAADAVIDEIVVTGSRIRQTLWIRKIRY